MQVLQLWWEKIVAVMSAVVATMVAMMMMVVVVVVVVMIMLLIVVVTMVVSFLVVLVVVVELGIHHPRAAVCEFLAANEVAEERVAEKGVDGDQDHEPAETEKTKRRGKEMERDGE